MLSKVVHDDFVWSAITGALSGKRRVSNTQFININCPMCVLRGESADRKQRCGIKHNPDGVGVSCFNCGFASRFKTGETLSKNMKLFLGAIGVPSREVQHINHKALQYRRLIANSPEAMAIIPTINRPQFQPSSLPPGAKTLSQWASDGVTDPDFFAVVEYLFGRGEAISEAMDYYWTPDTDNAMNRRILIPFKFNGQIVGWTGRLVDRATEKMPKYWSSVPSNFLFNHEMLESDCKFIILEEGPFDAIATDGVATLGAKLTDEQAHWLNTTGKTIIVLADRDKGGQRHIDHALQHNWMVSFPKLKDGHGFQNWWHSDVKDAAEASKRYGKLYTVRSIIESATSSKIEIGVKRRMLF
jgi:hypothetical protein